MPNKFRGRCHVAANWLVGTLALATTVIGATLKRPAHAANSPSHPVVDWFTTVVQAHGGGVLLALGVATGIAKVAAHRLGQPWAWNSVEAVLDELCAYAFEREPDDPVHYHRATLFKHKRCKLWIQPWRGRTPWGTGRWPFSGWLVPVARSGHATQRVSSVFLAPDDADKAEGVAGKTWAMGGVVSVPNLPNLNRTSSEANIDRYARRSWTPKEFIRRRLKENKPLPRAITGIPVYKKGEPWGVLVLDSRRPHGIKGSQANTGSFEIAQKLIEKLVRAL